MSTGYYLIDHENPNARPDADGRYHGYATRRSRVRVIVIHTAENTPDTVAADGGAEAVARYQAGVTRPSSYHDLVDSDSHVKMLPWDHTAFHAGNANSWSIGLSMATKAHLWPSMPARWTEDTLDNLATVAAAAVRWVKAVEGRVIPVRTISKHQAESGSAGFIAHGTLDPSRRSDPGATFPWGRFLSKTSAKLGQQPPPPPDNGDDDLTPGEKALLEECTRRLRRIEPHVQPITDGNQFLASVHEAANKVNYSVAGIGDNNLRDYIAGLGGPGGGPLSNDDVTRIAEAVADELQERLRS